MIKPFVFPLIVISFGSTPAFSSSIAIVELNGQNGQSTITLDPGTYTVDHIANAWNNRFGEYRPPDLGWLTDYGAVTSSGLRFGHGGPKQPSAAAAVAIFQTVSFTITERENVTFFIADPVPEDNIGSLRLGVNKLPDRIFEDDSTEEIKRFLESAFQYLEQSGVDAARLAKEYIEAQDFPGLIRRLGQEISGLTNSLGRVGGVVNDTLIGLLDTDSYRGTDALVRSWREKDTTGILIINENERRLLQELETEQQVFTPDKQGNFNEEVDPGTLYQLDPMLSPSYLYEVGAGDPFFFSVILPYLGDQNSILSLRYLDDGIWSEVFQLPSLFEFLFPDKVSAFEIFGIDIDNPLLNPDADWFVAASFASDGSFTGRVSPGQSVTTIPTPATFFLMASVLTILLGRRVASSIGAGRKEKR